MLSNGEFVVSAKAIKRYGHVLDAMNAGRMPAFVTGGFVGAINSTRANTHAPSVNVNVSSSQNAQIGQQVATAVSRAFANEVPDSFRRTGERW